jgi:hypothetical protein
MSVSSRWHTILNGIEEVNGSNPLGSTTLHKWESRWWHVGGMFAATMPLPRATGHGSECHPYHL